MSSQRCRSSTKPPPPDKRYEKQAPELDPISNLEPSTLVVLLRGVRDTREMLIRPETPADIPSVRSLTDAAFEGVEHSNQTEGAIVDALRNDGALVVSFVAEQDGSVVGHVGFSPVHIDGEDVGWFGLGPVSVSPRRQGTGIGSALIEAGLTALASRGAKGCVVLGDPTFYGRFGFTSDHALRYGGGPAAYFQSLVLCGEPVGGDVVYSKGFEAS